MVHFLYYSSVIPALDKKLGAYAASQTTVMHMKRLNQTESPIFVILCVQCFQRQSFLTFILPKAMILLVIY